MLMPADAALVARDRALPGLATLLDTDAFTTLLADAVPDQIIRDLRATYMRYKPGTNCLVAYRALVGDDPIEVYAKAYQPGDDDKRHKAQKLAKIATVLGSGSLLIDDQHLAIFVAPADRGLPALGTVLHDRKRARWLRRIVPGHPDLWTARVERLRYKPERRFVARLVPDRGAPAVLKLYNEHDYAVARCGARAFTAHDQFDLPTVLALDDDTRCQIGAWMPGQPLTDALHDPAFDCATLRSVGAALAALHAQPDAALGCPAPEPMDDALASAAAGIAAVQPELGSRAHDLAQRISRELLDQPQRSCALHGDFYADQVVLGDKLTLLDFDNATRGDPASDLGSFAAHVYADALRGALPLARAADGFGALVDGYLDSGDAATGSASALRLHVYTAAWLLRIAVEPFRYRMNDWPTHMAAIVTWAEEIARRDGMYA